MRQAILLATLVLTTLLSFAQKDQGKIDVLQVYYDSVFPKLYSGYSEKPVARYTSMPSFSNEYSFSIETTDSKHYIVSNSMSESYWYAKDRTTVRVLSNRAELSNDLYLKFVDLFNLMVEQPTLGTIMGGEDGTTYYFGITDKTGKVKNRRIWSPDENSLTGRLVRICDNIYSLGNGEQLLQTEILKEIEGLMEDMKE